MPKKNAPKDRALASSVVFDVRGEREIHYNLPAREAVIAAYAQFARKDHHTWEYESKYGRLAEQMDRSEKRGLPPGWYISDDNADFVAYDAGAIRKSIAESPTGKLPRGSIRTTPPKVVKPPKLRAKKHADRVVSADELIAGALKGR